MNRLLKIIIPLLLISCALSACSKKQKNVSSKTKTVSTIVVEAKNTPVSFTYVARTQSSHLVNIQSRVSGFLEKRVYKEGSVVKKNDILFVMDKKPFIAQVSAARAAVERQKAAHETARLNLDRVKPLAKLNALSQKDLDDAIGTFETTLASVAQARAQLETALLNLSYCTIRSPLDGITSSALQQDGSYLDVSDSKLTTVSALDPIWVNFSLSENQMQKYRDQVKAKTLIPPPKEQFTVKVIQVNGELFPQTGSITFTEPYYNSQTGTFLIRATLKNPNGLLRPNQYVRAQIEGAIRPNAIQVPQRAVRQSAKGHYVWIVSKDHQAEYRPVTVGEWNGENWFINEGLSSGDQVVVDGGMGLSSGKKVRVK